MDADATVELLREILAGVPRLTGAACIGRHELFDPLPGNGDRHHRDAERVRIARAAACCATCPVIRHCPSATVAAAELKVPA